jgi:hypothetical protein
VLLCGYHHRTIHRGDWRVQVSPRDGLPEFFAPILYDPAQRPRRNTYHADPLRSVTDERRLSHRPPRPCAP